MQLNLILIGTMIKRGRCINSVLWLELCEVASCCPFDLIDQTTLISYQGLLIYKPFVNTNDYLTGQVKLYSSTYALVGFQSSSHARRTFHGIQGLTSNRVPTETGKPGKLGK